MRCLVIRGEDEVLRFPVPEAEARLGSDPSNDLIVPIAGVSRFHARVVPDPVAPRLFDLESKNGLIVNGKRVREVALLPGLAVLAGAARITLEDGSTSDFDLALEFPRPSSASRRRDRNGTCETDGITVGPDGRAALGLLRDLERYEESARPRPEAGEFVERLRSVLGAQTVALVREGLSGRETIVLAGDESAVEGPCLALPEGDGRSLLVQEANGVAFAWQPAREAGGPSALVVMPMGVGLADWKKEFLAFGLDHITNPEKALGRELAAVAPRTPRLVLPDGMVTGASPSMRRLLGQIAKTVHSRMDVLVLGETGTGKELIARMIHASGPTADGPFVAINCAAIPSELLESELFGVRARVATGVDPQQGRILEAHGGTLLLDEIGELPLSLQPKLLRFLQEREVHSVGASRPEKVDVRVLSISNRDLQEDVRAGRFRADLYYRLRGLQFHVPPLRDRKADVAPLVTAFASRAAEEDGKAIRGVSRKALELLESYDWPGNVRELQSEVRRAVLFCATGSPLMAEHFRTVEWAVRGRQVPPKTLLEGGATLPARQTTEIDGETDSADLNLKRRVSAIECETIRTALERSHGNQTRAAHLLGLTRNGLALKLRRLFPDARSKR